MAEFFESTFGLPRWIAHAAAALIKCAVLLNMVAGGAKGMSGSPWPPEPGEAVSEAP